MVNTKKKRKFRARYIVLGILVLLLVAAGTFTVTNWDNIQAGYTGLTSNPEEIQAKQQEKKSELEKSLGLEDGFTDEEMSEAQEAILSLLPDSLAEFINGTASNGSSGTGTADGSNTASAAGNGTSGSASNGSGTTDGNGFSAGNGTAASSGNGSSNTGTGSSGSSSVSGSGTSSGTDAITRKYTAQLYALEGTMQGKINNLIASAKSEYASLPAGERTSAKKSAIVSSKLDEAEALESSCDAAVDTILSNMQSELKAAGGDTSAVSELREYYASEKASKKAAAIASMRGAG